MTVVKRTAVRSRLSQLVDSAGGVSVSNAVADAKRRLAALEPESRERVKVLAAELSALTPPAPEDLAMRMERAYDLSSGVLDAAGMFDQAELCAVATSLCDLIDAAGSDFDWRIVPVHARAMGFILALPPEAEVERRHVLAELLKIREKKLPGRSDDLEA